LVKLLLKINFYFRSQKMKISYAMMVFILAFLQLFQTGLAGGGGGGGSPGATGGGPGASGGGGQGASGANGVGYPGMQSGGATGRRRRSV
jgi:hypothetical protein